MNTKLLKILMVITLFTAIGMSTLTQEAYAKDKEKEEQVMVSKNKPDNASISHWNLDKKTLRLYFTGKEAISNEYQSTYFIESEYGIFTLHSVLEKKGHEIKSVLKDSNGEILFTNNTKLSNDRNFEIDIPSHMLAHSFESGLHIKITNPDKNGNIIISTANTIPGYLVIGAGIILAGGSVLLKRKKKELMV